MKGLTAAKNNARYLTPEGAGVTIISKMSSGGGLTLNDESNSDKAEVDNHEYPSLTCSIRPTLSARMINGHTRYHKQ